MTCYIFSILPNLIILVLLLFSFPSWFLLIYTCSHVFSLMISSLAIPLIRSALLCLTLSLSSSIPEYSPSPSLSLPLNVMAASPFLSPLSTSSLDYSSWPPPCAFLHPPSVTSLKRLFTGFMPCASSLFLFVQFPQSLPYVLITFPSCSSQCPLSYFRLRLIPPLTPLLFFLVFCNISHYILVVGELFSLPFFSLI